MDSAILDISYKWNRTIYYLLCLASFTLHNCFEVHSHGSKCQNLIPFVVGWFAPFCWSFIRWWTLGCFYLLAIENNAAMNIHMQAFIWIPVFNYLGCMPINLSLVIIFFPFTLLTIECDMDSTVLNRRKYLTKQPNNNINKMSASIIK